MQSNFQITVFPAEPLPLPSRDAVFGEVFLDEKGVEHHDFGSLDRPFGETYLELETVDLDDEQEIIRFVERWHPLGMKIGQAPHYSFGFDGFPGAENYQAFVDLLTDGGSTDPWAETVDEFRLGAWCLRDMATAWRVSSGQLNAEDAVWQAPCWSNSVNAPASMRWDKRPTLKEAVQPGHDPEARGPRAGALWDQAATPERVLALGFQFSLRPFAPRVNFTRGAGRQINDKELVDPELRMEPDALQSPANPAPPSIFGGELPLYSVLCLELFNHICEGATYRRCANETCEKWFVRQLGTAQHGQYRSTGVLYCLPECKQAQAQREYRRRKARREKN